VVPASLPDRIGGEASGSAGRAEGRRVADG